MQIYQVDAFTDRLFGGNPAAVLVLDEWLPDGPMLAIAQENNLAETAFVKARADGTWDLRWFAPAPEVDFCGYATLATAHVLMTAAATKTGDPLAFHTRVGQLGASKVRKGYQLDLPRLPLERLKALPLEIADVFDEALVRIFCNFENIFVDLGSAAAVRRFLPKLAAIVRLGPVGLVVTGQEQDGEHATGTPTHLFPLRVRARNTTYSLAPFDADRGVAPTEWQASRFPPALRSEIMVAHEGIDTDLRPVVAGAGVKLC